MVLNNSTLQTDLQIKMAKISSGEGQAATSDNKGSMELSEEVLEKLRMQYGLDKSVWTRYLYATAERRPMKVP